jgi:hypothetical protein
MVVWMEPALTSPALPSAPLALRAEVRIPTLDLMHPDVSVSAQCPVRVSMGHHWERGSLVSCNGLQTSSPEEDDVRWQRKQKHCPALPACPVEASAPAVEPCVT